MKIVYVSGAVIPSYTANSIHVMKMCQAISQEGHEVTLLAPRRLKNDSLKDVDLYQHYGVEPVFRLRWLPSPGKGIGSYIYSMFAIRVGFFEFGAELIFTRHLPAATLAALLGLPVVFEMHTAPGGRIAPILFRVLLASRGLRRIVLITQALRELLLDAYPESIMLKQALIAPDGVDLERFQTQPSPSESRSKLDWPERLTVGYAGHLYSGRGIELIVALARHFHDIEFPIMGGKPDDVSRWRHETRHNEPSNIHFLGFVSNSLLPLYLAACDILLMPYQQKVSASGGGDIAKVLSPMKMFEYMASGRLIISSDLPVLREVLCEETALFVDPEDMEGWVQALGNAATDPKLREKLGRQARQAASEYTWRKRVSRCLDDIS